MSEIGSPEMSVIIATPDRYETIRSTIKHLRAQTVREKLEIVIVAPSVKELDLDESELEGFFGFRVVEVGRVKSVGWANAAGIRQASSPVVVISEDHSFPDPHWAEALIEAHKRPWAAVGPAMRNANPDSLISWAEFLTAFRVWLDPPEAGVAEYLPAHNSSYKRAILMEYGAELEVMMGSEIVLHRDLRSKGYKLYLEPAAVISHLNVEFIPSWVRARFYHGRLFAAIRSRHWTLLRRLIYTCGSPLIPIVLLRRILKQIRHTSSKYNLLPRVLPALILGLVFSAAGEMVGYAFGLGNTNEKMADIEFHRVRHIAKPRI